MKMKRKVATSILLLILLWPVHFTYAVENGYLRPVAAREKQVVVKNQSVQWLAPPEFIDFIKNKSKIDLTQITKDEAIDCVGHMEGMLDSHKRAILERGELDLLADLNLNSGRSASLEQARIVDFEREDSAFDHVYAIYSNGGIVGYGVYSVNLNYDGVVNFRLTILEHTSEGNGYTALKLILNMIYKRYSDRGPGLVTVEMPPFANLNGNVYQHAWDTEAPLFFVRAAFQPRDVFDGATALEILKLREGELSAGDRWTLNKRLFDCALRLRLERQPLHSEEISVKREGEGKEESVSLIFPNDICIVIPKINYALAAYLTRQFNVALSVYNIVCWELYGWGILRFLDRNTGRQSRLNLSNVTEANIKNCFNELLPSGQNEPAETEI